jgi:hypothetical protein
VLCRQDRDLHARARRFIVPTFDEFAMFPPADTRTPITVRRESPMLLPVLTAGWEDDGAGSIHCRQRIEGRQLMSLQQVALGTLANAGRALSPAADRKGQVKYDGDILHIIEQYPGCDDAHVLAFLCARVHWFGRGTLIHKVFSPSLSTVRAAGRRLEVAGKIKAKVDHSQHHQLLRFYPNTPVWARRGP